MMSTRWQIAARLSDGRCGCIYVHFDGYPEHALRTLQDLQLARQRLRALYEGL